MANPLPSAFDEVELLRPFSTIRLIAADLDGTLLPSPLAERLQRAIRSLCSYGVRFTLATGRTFSGVKELTKRLELPSHTPLVLYNGSVVLEVDTGCLLRRATISAASLNETLSLAAIHKCDIYAYFCRYPMEAGLSDIFPGETVIGWNFETSDKPKATREFNGCEIVWAQDRLTTFDTPSAVLISLSGDVNRETLLVSRR